VWYLRQAVRERETGERRRQRERVGELVRELVRELVGELVRELVRELVGELVGELMREFVGELARELASVECQFAHVCVLVLDDFECTEHTMCQLLVCLCTFCCVSTSSALNIRYV